MVNGVYPSPTSPTQGPQRTLPLAPPKGGEYNVLLMGHKSVVTTPSPCGRVGEGSVAGGSALHTIKNFYIPLCPVQGGKSSYRQCSVLAWNQP